MRQLRNVSVVDSILRSQRGTRNTEHTASAIPLRVLDHKNAGSHLVLFVIVFVFFVIVFVLVEGIFRVTY